MNSRSETSGQVKQEAIQEVLNLTEATIRNEIRWEESTGRYGFRDYNGSYGGVVYQVERIMPFNEYRIIAFRPSSAPRILPGNAAIGGLVAAIVARLKDSFDLK